MDRVKPPQIVFSGNSEMSRWLQSQDWDHTALGSVANWPLSLQTSLSILLNTACPMVLVWGRDRYLFFNDGYANLGLNSGPTLIPGQPLHNCSQPNGGELLTAIEQVFTTAQPQQQVLASQGMSGEQLWLWCFSPLWDGGQVGGVFATGCAELNPIAGTTKLEAECRQVETERQHLSEALLSEKARFEAVLRQLPEGVMIADAATGNLILTNERADQLMRHSYALDFQLEAYESWVPFQAYRTNGQRYAPEDYPLVRSLRQGEIIAHEEMELRFADGSQIFIDVNAAPILDYQGQITSAVTVFQDISERKQLEAERQQALIQLQERQHFIQQVADATPGTLYVYDMVAQRNIYVNRQIGELLGYTPADIQAYDDQLFAQLIHPEDLATIGNQYTRLNQAQADEVIDYEYRMRHANGEWRWLWSRNTVSTRTPEGLAHLVVGTVQDITDRKQAELALQQTQVHLQRANERFELAAKAVNCLIYDWDVEQDRVERTEGFTRLLGYSLEEAEPTGAWWRQQIHPEDVQRLSATAISNLLNNDLQICEYRVRTKDNRYIYVLDQALVVCRDAKGYPTRMVGSTTDITDRKRAEAQLQQQEQEFRTLVENTPDVIIRYDRNLRYLYINPSIERIIGIPPEQLIGKTGIELGLIDPTSQAWYRTLEQVFNTGQHHWLEFEFPNPEGELHAYQARFVPELVEGEQITTVLAVATDVTEYKRTELLLRQSEERLRLAMAAAQMATWDVDLNTGKAFWSEHHFTMLGYEPVAGGEASEAMWSSCIHPEDLERVLQAWQQARLDRTLYRAEYRVIRVDNGQIAWLMGLGSFTYDETGQAIRSIGVLLDISEQQAALQERKRVEDELRESEQRLQLAQQAGRIGTWDWNLLTNEVSWSDGIWPLLALEPKSVKPDLETFTHFIHPEDREQAFRTVKLALAEGDDYYDEFRVIRQDGAICWLLSKGRVIRTPEGQPQRLLGINVDITDRKQAEEALRQSEERLRLALLVSQSGIWDWDIVNKQITWSERIYQFHGLTPDTFGGTVAEFAALIHPEDRERVAAAIQRALAGESSYELEFRAVQPSGAIRWLSTTGGVIFDQQGQPVRMLGATNDITDRKAIEAERERLLLSERRCREAAESANRIKDEFLAVLSHELRSPLNPILGWTKLLQTRPFDPQRTQQALQTIERNAKLQTQLIEDLLDISRILQGKMVLNTSPVNLITTIEAALDTVRLAAETKGIELQTCLSPAVGRVYGDSTRLQQIVWNLLTNAVKFTPAGGKVLIRLEQVDSFAQIQVQDTGKGISPAFLPHVFEYFRQEDSQTTRKFGGLGLGLAIVRYLTEQHGGTVEVESRGEDQGASFTVHLPLMASDLTPDPAEQPCIETAQDLRGLQILIVDDDADMRDLLSFILTEQGATVRVAASASEGLQHLSASPLDLDLLISDIGMPEMDGYSLIRQARHLLAPTGKELPAIALTAYAGEINQQQALAAGFQLHLAKPIEPDQLLIMIKNLVFS